MGVKGTLLGVFSESPFKVIDEHMQQSVASAALLVDFFVAVLSGDWEHSKLIQEKISHLESLADKMQRKVNRLLYKAMFLPVSRYDVLSLVKSQDSIANQAEDIAGFVLRREMLFPSSMHEKISLYVQSSVEVCKEAEAIVKHLGVVMQSGFSSPCIDEIERMVDKLHQLEHDNDLLQVDLRLLLKDEEKRLSPIDVMFMYKVLERIGNLADNAHHIGEKFSLMLVSL